MSTRLPFTAPALLAPMEGVTEPCFRDLVLARNPPEALGGAFTEFVRVVDRALPKAILRRHLGPIRHAMPVGLQLMGSDAQALAATAANAVEAGAPLLDLNFGCPAKGALAGCAGSAVLRDPGMLERLVATCVRAVAGAIPVTAKIRAGYDDDADIESLARAAQSGGAALLTIHCRTRAEGYRDDAVDWRRIERAVAAVAIPVCGNGGIGTHADFARLRERTGATFAMSGRAALADPWIFSGRNATFDDARAFLVEYFDTLIARGGFAPAGALARSKQLVHTFRAGDYFGADRRRWLTETDPEHYRRALVDRQGTMCSSIRNTSVASGGTVPVPLAP